MISQIEMGHSNLPEVHHEQNDPANNSLPHGVSPETYGLLLFAHDHKEILDIVDSLDKGKRVRNPARNLLFVYYFNEVSGRDLHKFVGGDRVTNGNRMLEALEVIWQHAPLEIQLQYPKEKAVSLKESPLASPRTLKKISEHAKTIWQTESYREKSAESRKNNPDFIQHMREVKKGVPPPNKGRKIVGQALENIRVGGQKRWNRQYGMEPNTDSLTKRKILVDEWIRLTQLLKHTPSYPEIRKLKKDNKTKFSEGVYQEEFGQGSFTKAREILTCISSVQEFATVLLQNPSKILSHSVLEKDVKAIHATIMSELSSILSTSSVEEVEKRTKALNDKIPGIKGRLDAKMPHHFDLHIGRDEKSMWSYAIDYNLLPKMLQVNMITQQEIDLIRGYFENRIIGEDLTEEIFDRFTIAVAKAS